MHGGCWSRLRRRSRLLPEELGDYWVVLRTGLLVALLAALLVALLVALLAARLAAFSEVVETSVS